MRDKILERLKEGPATLNAISKHLDIERSEASVIVGEMVGSGDIVTSVVKTSEGSYLKVYQIIEV